MGNNYYLMTPKICEYNYPNLSTGQCFLTIMFVFMQKNSLLCMDRFFIFDILIYQKVLTVESMRDLIDSDSGQELISPTAFIAGLQHPYNFPELKFQNDEKELSEVDMWRTVKGSLDDCTKGSEKIEKKRLAGMKSRQKKKKYLEYLEENVKKIANEIQEYDTQISKCKDKLVDAIKTSNNTSSQHSYTFTELQRASSGEDPDLDRINLLLDLIQNRIGANAKERQSKLDYNFKQIINSLFPAGHRYFMHSAVYQTDLFEDDVKPQLLISQRQGKWTKNFYQQLGLTQAQLDKISKKKPLFINKRKETINLITKLRDSKNTLKQQEEIFERALNQIREDMSPVQSAQLILFGEKNKLRKQCSLFSEEFCEQYKPEKKIKMQ